MENNSVITSSSDKVLNIDDEKLKDALNISDNESLESNIILEEGVKIPVSKLNIQQFEQQN